MQGIVNVYKEKGWTSFDVVNKLKRVYNTGKIGHLGTLDPMAEGVLPIAVGKATKLFDLYLKKTKTYLAEFTFGYETDTLDAEGEIIKKTDSLPTVDKLRKALVGFVGKINQVPPQYSAVKINGQRAYDLARKNIDFEISAKEVTIFSFELNEVCGENTYTFLIECSAGTYIRSLARDLAESVGSLATMTKLTRLRSGEFRLEDSRKIEEVVQNPESALMQLESIFKDLEKIEFCGEIAKKIQNGVKVSVGGTYDADLKAIYIEGRFFAIGKIKEGRLNILVRLSEGE